MRTSKKENHKTLHQILIVIDDLQIIKSLADKANYYTVYLREADIQESVQYVAHTDVQHYIQY